MAGLTDLFGFEQKGIDQLSPGVRKAKLERIDLSKIKEDGWHVTLENGKTIQTTISTDYGVEWLPAGEVKGNFLYPTTEVTVNLQQNSDLKTSKIISTEQKVRQDDPLPNSTRIVRGNSQTVVHDNYIELVIGNSIIKLDPNEIEIDANSIKGVVETGEYTDQKVLDKLKNVDGAGSLLDADLLDGHEYSEIIDALALKLNSSVYTATDVFNKVKSLDGAGSLLDADLLDGHEYSEISGSITSLTGNISDLQGSVSNLNTAISEKARYASTTVANVTGGSAGTVDVTINAQPALSKCVCFTTGANSAKIQISSASGSTYTIRYIFDSNGTNRTIYVLYFT